MSRTTYENMQIMRKIESQPKSHQLHIRLSDFEYSLLNDTVSRINENKGQYASKCTVSDIIREGILNTCKAKIKN